MRKPSHPADEDDRQPSTVEELREQTRRLYQSIMENARRARAAAESDRTVAAAKPRLTLVRKPSRPRL
jgi:hypothetical protein